MTALLAILATTLAYAQPPTLPADVAEAGATPDAFATTPAPGFDLSPTAVADDAPPPNLGKWKGAVSLGATVAEGNTRRKTATATANAELRREKDRTTLGFLWNYAKESGVTTQRRTLGTAKYDYFLSKKHYVFGQASGESDLNAQLQLRTTIGAGVGYQFLEDERWNVSGEAGLSYVDENYKDNNADADFLAARLAYKAEWKPNERWSAGQTGEIFPSLEDKDDVSARVDTHAKVTLTENMFAQFQWLYTWDNTVAGGAKHVDNLYLLTIGWSF